MTAAPQGGQTPTPDAVQEAREAIEDARAVLPRFGYGVLAERLELALAVISRHQTTGHRPSHPTIWCKRCGRSTVLTQGDACSTCVIDLEDRAASPSPTRQPE